MRFFTFVFAVILLAGAIDPTRGPLIALVVISGLAAMRWRSWTPLTLRPVPDFRFAPFIFALLLLGGALDPTRSVMIILVALAGAAMIAPGVFRLQTRRNHWRFGGYSRQAGWERRGGHSEWEDGWR